MRQRSNFTFIMEKTPELTVQFLSLELLKNHDTDLLYLFISFDRFSVTLANYSPHLIYKHTVNHTPNAVFPLLMYDVKTETLTHVCGVA